MHNVNGVAILYADKITNSMKATIEETKRCREKQMKFNEEHGIVPQQIKKQVKDIKTACTTKKTRVKKLPNWKGPCSKQLRVCSLNRQLFFLYDRIIQRIKENLLFEAKSIVWI